MLAPASTKPRFISGYNHNLLRSQFGQKCIYFAIEIQPIIGRRIVQPTSHDYELPILHISILFYLIFDIFDCLRKIRVLVLFGIVCLAVILKEVVIDG